MEGLAPPLDLCIHLRLGVESGDSPRVSIKKYLLTHHDSMSVLVRKWLLLMEQESPTTVLVDTIASPYQRSLLMVLEKGFRGETILPQLVDLETDIYDACLEDIERFTTLLPFKLLVPLLLFQFPAFLILLFGPLLQEFIGLL